MNMDNQLYQAAVRRQLDAHQAPPPPDFYAQAPGFHALQAPPMPLAVAHIDRNNDWTPPNIAAIVTRQEKILEALVVRQDKMAERQDKMFELMTKEMIEVVWKQNQQMEENSKNTKEMFEVLMGTLATRAIAPPTSETAPTLPPVPAPAPAHPAPIARATRSAPYRKRQQPERKIIESKGCILGEASEYNEGKKSYRKYSCAKCERTFLSLSGLKNHFNANHQ